MTFSVSGMAASSDQWKATSMLFGKHNASWSVYYYPGIGNTRVAEMNGNHCTNIISKIIAYVCSFFGYGTVVTTELPNRQGEMESHTFWIDRDIQFSTHSHLSIKSEGTGWFYEKISSSIR